MNDNMSSPNFDMIKGLLAVVVGVVLLISTYKMILSIICFIAGLILIHYGLLLLNIKHVQDFTSYFSEQWKKLMSRIR